jgi:cobyrinic acid a,c-diamide synthase
MALVIAGERSGVGKTTITLALLAYLKRRLQNKETTVQSFKVGPDYIDPMFHHYVTGRPCRNLDPVLTSEEYIQQCFAHHSQGVEFAIVEGVMGLFDGVSGKFKDTNYSSIIANDFASTAHIARILDLPILLVIDCSRLSGSVAAIAHGYRSWDSRINIAGLLLNRVGSDRHLELLKEALDPLHLPILGVLKREDNITIPDRHLGLVPTAELPELNQLLDRLADIAAESFDWENLLPLLKGSSTITQPSPPNLFTQDITQDSEGNPVKIAIARDAAFSFYYQDNLDILASLGAELVSWSPLTDRDLPADVQGLYFGGGFPEMFAEQLSQNSPGRDAVFQAIQSGIPTYAECGGLMYLCAEIIDFDRQSWPMVGILPSKTLMDRRLTLGYRRAIARKNTPLLVKDAVVFGHEFHRSRLTDEPVSPLFETWRLSSDALPMNEGWANQENIHASYIHLHWGSCPEIPQRFLQHCRNFSGKNTR